MKKIFFVIAALAILVVWTACEKEEEKVTLDLSQSVAPVLADPGTIVLSEETASELITFQWSSASYALDNLPDITYRLEFKPAGGSQIFVLTETDLLTFSLTQNALNARLVNAGFETGEEAEFHFMVHSFIRVEANGTKLTSAPRAVALTPFEASVIETAMLWVPGAYQGWSPATAPNVFSPTDNNIYNGYVHFPEGTTSLEFKFTSAPNWDNTNYGFAGPGLLDTDPGAGNLSVTAVGTWYMTVNTDELTWSTEARNFALIGTFNNWAADEPLTWDNDNKVFTVTRDFVAGDKFKWRANGGWAINYGANDPDDGTLVQDGKDIELTEAGNYTIILNLYTEVPTYEIIKN